MPSISSKSRGLGPASLTIICLFGMAPFQAAYAQGAGTGPVAPPGSITIIREVPTRPAYEPGVGDANWVETTPARAFADALDLGLSILDDTTAAGIASGPAMSQFPMNGAYQATDQVVTDTLISSGLGGISQPGGGSVGAAVGASLDAGLSAAGAGIDSALGAVTGALSGLGGLGQ